MGIGMYSSLSQTHTQTQVQTLAPQLRQSLKILQVPLLELRHAILEELQTNPVLEEVAPNNELDLPLGIDGQEMSPSDWDENVLTRGDSDREFSFDEGYNPDAERQRQHFFDSIVQSSPFEDSIMEEARVAGASENVCKALEYILGNIDERGFLEMDLKALAEMAELEEPVFEEALDFLKTIEPYGLGAPNLQMCLLWQLEAVEKGGGLAALILRDHYPLLLKNKTAEIAKALRISVEEVLEAIEAISQLNPSPGSALIEETTMVVTPDIIIERSASEWVITMPRLHIPNLRVNPRYHRLLEEGDLAAQDQSYIKDKIREGAVLIHALEQRQATLKRIAQVILDDQQAFFEQGVSHLKPMTMQQVALILGLHETTISRAVAHKYLKCPAGIFELKYFFSTGYASAHGPVSSKSIQDRISKLIAHEDPRHPLSDQVIAKLLVEEDPTLQIARRTIAKYREQLRISPTHLRRK
jgi:RNA polymerase sigma-54 factor